MQSFIFDSHSLLQVGATNIETSHSEFVELVKKMLNNSDQRQRFFQVSMLSHWIYTVAYWLFLLYVSVKSVLIRNDSNIDCTSLLHTLKNNKESLD